MMEFTDDVDVYLVGEPIMFRGWADDFSKGIAAVEFTLDGGKTWTRYPTRGAARDRGIRWSFSYTPQAAGTYLLRARTIDSSGAPSPLISNFAFSAIERDRLPREYGTFHLRAFDGGPLRGARLFRSAALGGVSAEDALFISGNLGIRSIYDIRGAHEVNAAPEPYLLHVKTVTLEAEEGRRRKDASKRLVAGMIGQYGEPEERMCSNYRRYAREYPIIGMALRSIASQKAPALVHCVNGKDRTGVLCAVACRVAGFDGGSIMAEYLRSNEINALEIAEERSRLSVGMDDGELAILDSFLQARPAYLEAFFDEAERDFGSFEQYVADGLHLTHEHRENLKSLLQR